MILRVAKRVDATYEFTSENAGFIESDSDDDDDYYGDYDQYERKLKLWALQSNDRKAMEKEQFRLDIEKEMKRLIQAGKK